MRPIRRLLLSAACLWPVCSPLRAEPPCPAIKVYLLDLGRLECDANWMVAMSVVGTKVHPNPPAQWITIPVYAVLVDHPQGKFLFDTGCPPETVNEPDAVFPYYHDESQTLARQLALAHAEPQQIKAVVLSHLHFDHAGGMGLFPQAEVYLGAKELEHARAQPSGLKIDLASLAGRCHTVDQDQPLADGLTLIQLPGHSPGLVGLMVKLPHSGTLLFPSDAVYTRVNFGPPAKLSGIVYDSLSFSQSIEKVRDLARQHAATVVFPHDMEFFRTLKTAPAAYD